jgi:hypothetical protein
MPQSRQPWDGTAHHGPRGRPAAPKRNLARQRLAAPCPLNQFGVPEDIAFLPRCLLRHPVLMTTKMLVMNGGMLTGGTP